MILWRISNWDDLRGTGGLRHAGRWHNRGIPVIYCAEHPALALLETLVHFELAPDEVPDQFKLLQIEVSDTAARSNLDLSVLDPGWQADLTLTRAIGDEWLAGASSLMLRVPSAIVPESFNFLVNPRHRQARTMRIRRVIEHPYDTRLFSITE